MPSPISTSSLKPGSLSKRYCRKRKLMPNEGLMNTRNGDVAKAIFHMVWCCPKCHTSLPNNDDWIGCPVCNARYEVIEGIPDFRISTDFWLDIEHDRTLARKLAAQFSIADVEGLVRQVFASRPEWDDARVALRTRQVLDAPKRLQKEIDGWLDQATKDTPFLEIGCGPGMLLAAAASKGRVGIGIDASLVWLVVAKRLITRWGGQPVLAAALADALPLADNAVHATISLDVIEHVSDQQVFLQEIDRVTRVGGRLALATPNRFSLAAEPHVSVWGVGWLPRPWQAAFVRWRSGKSYTYTRLLSTWEAARIVRRNTAFSFRILLPKVPEEEMHRFPPYRRVLARVYNRLSTFPLFRWLFLVIGPFFRVVGVRAGK